ERAQRNEFESMFGTEKDANGNMMFSPISATGSTYVYLGGSIPVNAATLPNVDPPTDPLMPGLEDTANTKIFSGAYNDEVEAAKADFNNFELSTVDANGNSTYRMFTPVSVHGSSYVNLSGSIPVNAATLPNTDLLTNPLMPDLEDTVDLQDTRIFNGAYDDKVKSAVADFNNLEL
nr:hypothetical protein [Tanacetum cinerariifolium]